MTVINKDNNGNRRPSAAVKGGRNGSAFSDDGAQCPALRHGNLMRQYPAARGVWLQADIKE